MSMYLNSILSDILNGYEITPAQRAFLMERQKKQEERRAFRREMTKRNHRDFQNCLMQILNENRDVPLTATEIQFLIPHAMDARISVQKVSKHLAMMAADGDFPVQNRKVWVYDCGCRPAVVWFVGEPEFEKHPIKNGAEMLYRSGDFWQNILSFSVKENHKEPDYPTYSCFAANCR